MTATDTTRQAKEELLVRKIEQMTAREVDYLRDVMRMARETDLSIHEIFVSLAPNYGIDPSVFDTLSPDHETPKGA